VHDVRDVCDVCVCVSIDRSDNPESSASARGDSTSGSRRHVDDDDDDFDECCGGGERWWWCECSIIVVSIVDDGCNVAERANDDSASTECSDRAKYGYLVVV
jgi:hypothetical protein